MTAIRCELGGYNMSFTVSDNYIYQSYRRCFIESIKTLYNSHCTLSRPIKSLLSSLHIAFSTRIKLLCLKTRKIEPRLPYCGYATCATTPDLLFSSFLAQCVNTPGVTIARCTPKGPNNGLSLRMECEPDCCFYVQPLNVN